MKELVQIIYISRSTFESLENVNKIEPNVARILAKSRVNNRKNGLVGVLYFGDGAFFQCLEGEEEAVNNLLTKLKADTRHKDLKIISKKPIHTLSFGVWAMKFTPLDEQITKFLKENGFKTFDPYLFSNEVTHKFLALLFNADDNNSESKLLESLNSTLVPEPQNTGALRALEIKTNIALILSILGVLISLFAFLSSRH